jgi:hypothetical protein
VHARRPFFAMADIEENARRKAAGKKEIALSPIAIEIVRRIDALFEIERSINGKGVEERLAHLIHPGVVFEAGERGVKV